MSRDNRHEYAQAVGAAAAHNVTDPWRVAAAVANDAAWHVGKRIVEHGTRHEEEEASAQTLESTGLQPDEFRVNVKDLADEADPRALPAVETPVAAEASEQSATPDAGDIGTAEEGAHSGVKQDVILRLETLTVRETKYAMGVVWAATLIAFGALFAEFGVKLQWDDSSRILHHDTVDIINVVVGSILACQLLRSLVWLSFVVVRTWQTKRVWKRRRLRNVVFFFIEIIAQLINVVTLIASNAYAIHNKCSWLSNATAWLNFVTWTCWNTIFLIFLIQVCSPMPQKVLRLPLPSRKARPHSNRPPPHIPGSKAPSGPSKDLPLNEPSKTLPPHEPSNNLPPNEPSKDVHQHKAASASHHDLSKGATELSKNFHSTVQELPKNQHTKAASASHHDLVKGATELCKGVLQPFKTVHSHEPTLIVDGSMWLHLPKYLLWLLTEATLIALCCYQYYHCESLQDCA